MRTVVYLDTDNGGIIAFEAHSDDTSTMVTVDLREHGDRKLPSLEIADIEYMCEVMRKARGYHMNRESKLQRE